MEHLKGYVMHKHTHLHAMAIRVLSELVTLNREVTSRELQERLGGSGKLLNSGTLTGCIGTTDADKRAKYDGKPGSAGYNGAMDGNNGTSLLTAKMVKYVGRRPYTGRDDKPGNYNAFKVEPDGREALKRQAARDAKAKEEKKAESAS